MSTGLIIGICVTAIAAALILQFRKRKGPKVNKCLAHNDKTESMVVFNIWRHINKYRRTQKLSPYGMSSLLNRHAEKRSEQVSGFVKPSHYGIGKVREKINAECQTEAISEVLAFNFPKSQLTDTDKFAKKVVDAWINSPEHEEILSDSHDYWGSGIYIKGKRVFITGFTAH